MDLENKKKALEDREMELVSGGVYTRFGDRCPFCESGDISHLGVDTWLCNNCQKQFDSRGDEVM